MNEQLLKDFIATAQKYNYNWNTVFGKFPELKGYDQQLLKDYVATAEKYNYDYGVVNSKFPELGLKQEPLKKKESTELASKSEKPTSASSSKRRFEGVTEEPISQKKFRTDDYIDQVQNAKKQPKPQPTTTKNQYTPKVEEQKFDVLSTKEANEMMAQDFGKKEFELYSQISEIDPSVFSQGETASVKYLNDKFKGSGFVFEETGVGNSVKIKSTLNDGFGTVVNEKVIDLPSKEITAFGLVQNKTQNEAKDEIAKFMNQAFLKKSEKEFLNKDVQDYGQMVKLAAENPYKYGEGFLNKYDTERWIDKQYIDLVTAGKSIKREQELLNAEIKAYQDSGVYNEETERLIRGRSASIQNQVEANTKKYNELQDITSRLPQAAAVYFQNKEKQGNAAGLLLRKFTEGAMSLEFALMNTAADVVPLVVPSKYIIPEVQQARLKASGMSDAEIKDYASKQLRQGIVDQAQEAVLDFWSGGTTEEYIQSKDRGDIEKTAAFLANSIGTAVSGGGNPLLTRIAFFAQSYNAIEDEMNSPEFDDLSQMEKKIMSVPYGLVIGALDRLGFNVSTNVAKNPLVNSLITNTIARTFTSLPKNASIEMMDQAISENLKATMAKAGLEIVGGALVEGATEGTQSLAEYAMKDLYNLAIAEKDVFKDVVDITTKEGFNKALDAAKEEAYYGTLGGLIMSSGSQALKSISSGFDGGKEEFDFFEKVINDPNLRALIQTDLKTKITSGELTKAEVAEQIDAINKSASILNSIPNDIDVEGKKESYNLILERNKLDKQKEGKDPNLVKPITDRINEINNRLQEISIQNAVQEQGADAVPVQSGAGVSTEMEERVSETEPQGVTGETITEEVKVEGPKAEQPQAEVAKEEVVQSEENQALIDDYVKSQTEFINGATTISQEEKQQKIQELESDPVAYAENNAGKTEIFGETPHTDLLNSLQRQPVAQETAVVEEAQQPTEKLTVNPSEGYSFEYESENDIPAELKGVEPTGRTETKVGRGKNAKTKLKLTFTGQQLIDAGLAVTPEAQAEVVQPVVQETVQAEVQAEPTAKIESIEVEEVPQVEQSLNDLTQQNNVLTENDFTAARIRNVGKEKVVAQIQKAAKAIAKVLPNVKIIVHATPEAFVEATKDMDGRLSEGGLYDQQTGQIHINLERANNRTVAHEVFHALILSRVNSDVEAQRLTRSMIKSVLKSIKKAEGTTELISYLEEFESNYDENIKNEEKLAELFGVLADNYKAFPPASKNIIVRFLNRLAKALGLKEMTDREAIEFMNTLSRKVETGQEIEVSEVGQQKEGKAAVRKQKGDVVKSKINEDYDHVITLNGKEIGKIFYDKSQKTWNNSDFDRRGVKPNTYQWVYGDVVGENKQEAIDEMVRRYKEKEAKSIAPTQEAKIKYTNDQVTNNFLNALNEKSNVSRNPIDNRSFIYGDKAFLEFSRFDKGDRNEIAIQSISTFDKGKGVGKQVMKDITDTADELGVTLTLDAKPFGNEGLSKEQLINFYKKNGFVADIEEMFGGEFESEEELIDYVINEEPDAALQMTREPSTREFAVRKQKTTGPSRIVENGVKAGKTDADIRQEGRAAGFTNKEMTEALSKYYTKEQGVFMKSGVKGLVGRFVDGARRFKQQFLTTKGLLPKIGFTYKEKMEGEISAEANRAAKTAKKFGVLFDKFTGDKELLKDAFDKVLRGDKSIQLPAGFAALANEMRNHIDRLSQMLIATGAVDADMADTIRKNMGTYITRSYEIFDNKNFRQKVGEQELQAAKNFLRTQPGMIALAQAEAARTNVTVDEALDILVDNKIDEYFADAETGALVKGSRLGSKDLSTLKERKEIPEQIRMLMGEYSDPAMNYARTVLNIATLAARHQFLTQVKEAGMGKFFFEKNDSQRPKGFDTEIASEGSDTMSPLNGLMTTPEIAEAFGLYDGQKGEDTWVQQAIKIYYKAMGLVKWLKTIASVGTHMKNVFSNFGFVGVNGHSLIEIGKAAKVVAQDLKTMSKPEVEAKIDEYIKAGIMRQGAGVNEIREMFKDADMDNFLERRLSMRKPKGVMGRIKQAISSRSSKIISFAEDLYQAEDDMFKIAAYETEMNRYADALYNKSKDQLTDKEKQKVSEIAANNVKNTYPTYSRIPEGIKRLRRFPLFIGSFISFQAESYRTAYNTIALAKDELSSDNKKIKAIGVRRVVGAGTYLTAKTALLSYAGYAAGTGIGGVLGALFDDDDEEKKQKDVRSFLPPWSQNSDIIILKAADGEVEYIDFSASDPHGGINKALNALFSGEDLLDSFKKSTLELVGQFQGPDILTNLAIQLKGNENDFGKPIYNEEDSFAEKSDKILDYVYKVVEPGTITSVRKGVFSEQSLGQLAFGEATGLKIRKVNVKDQFGYKLPEFDESFKDIRKIYKSEYYKSVEMYDDPKATEKDIKEQNKKTDEALVRANEKYAAKAKELMDLINSANRLGVDYDDLINELGFIKSTMGKSNISEMENGGDEFIKEKEY